MSSTGKGNRWHFGIKTHASIRAKVEHVFRIVKCQFGYIKTRYRGLEKNAMQIYGLVALRNLYQARHQLANKSVIACVNQRNQGIQRLNIIRNRLKRPACFSW